MSISILFKKILFVCMVFLMGAMVYGEEGVNLSQKFDTPFNTSEIIEQVSYYTEGKGKGLGNNQITEWSREGEFLIDTNVVYAPAPEDQVGPSVAFDGTNYLVVWQDSRSGSDDIYASRVSPTGTVLDSLGIVIATDGARDPSVAFDGTNYLVVWGSYDIYGARISPAGTMLDSFGIRISTTAYAQSNPSITFGTTNYLVVWHEWHDGSYDDIYGARVSPAGTVLDSSGIAIATGANKQKSSSVAFDGMNYLVVWEDHRSAFEIDIYGARVDQSGCVLDSSGIVISDAVYAQWSPSVAFDGTNYLVVWSDKRSGPCDIYGARVSPAGTVLVSGIAIATGPNSQGEPSVAFDGTNYLVVWKTYVLGGLYYIYGARVSPGGIVLDSSGIAISNIGMSVESPVVAFDGINYLVAWPDRRNGYYDIYGARVSPAGTVLDSSGIVVSLGANSQREPSVAFDGSNYLVVWHDWRSGATDIYGARVSQTGMLLDSSSIVISDAVYAQWSPSVAFDGTNYLVVWEDNQSGEDICGARVSPEGIVLDPSGIAICAIGNSQNCPSVAFDGSNYLVVWHEWHEDPYNFYDIYGARVSPAGTVLDPSGIAIATGSNYQWASSVAFDGTNYLVVWKDGADIYGARVSPAGTVLDPSGIAICTTGRCPSVAFDGTNYLVVWEDNEDIYGARVSPAGTVLDPSGITISTAAEDQKFPSVAFDGTNYLVVWQDSRNGSWDIYGAKVNTSGTVISSYAVSAQPGDQISPALTHGTEDSILITYSGWTDSINTYPVNTMRIWGKFYPFVGIEENDQRPELNTVRSLQVYPNPVRKNCNVKYFLSQKTMVNLSIFDVTGRLIKDVVNKEQNMGIYKNVVDMSDLAQGVYFLRFDTNVHSDTKKVIYIK